MSKTPSRPRAAWILLILGLTSAAAVSLYFWRPWSRENLTLAAEANARGIGHMEQFDSPDGYPKAIQEFQKAVVYAPNWLPAKINLGIAIYNTAQGQTDPVLDRAAALFREVLAREPDNPYAHYNLGIIALYRNDLDVAAKHFAEVTRIDPNDAHAWYHRGITHPQKDDSPEAKEFFAKALKLNPYLNAARYALALHGHDRDEAKTRELLAEKKALEDANWESEYRIRYTEMGKYAEVIGRSPINRPLPSPFPIFDQTDQAKVRLEPGTRWAKANEFGELQAYRDRFSGVILRLDFNKDRRPDVLLLGAVIRDGKLGDLLLQNQGGGEFLDVSQLLPTRGASIGGAVGDFNNDGWPDLVLTHVNGVTLLNNRQGQSFQNDTDQAGLTTLTGPFLTASWLDLDQDSDLDLLLVKSSPEPGLVVRINAGEAKPNANEITTSFQPMKNAESLEIRAPVTGLIATDYDDDRDVDMIVLVDGRSPELIVNDRLLRFRREIVQWPAAQQWLGGLVLSSEVEGPSDVLLLADQATRFFRRGQPATVQELPKLLQAQVQDVNLDGITDVVGLSADRRPIVLMGTELPKLKPVNSPFGPAPQGLTNIQSLAVADFLGDGQPSLIIWSDNGLSLWKNNGVGTSGLPVELTGRRDQGSNLRTNADGVGSLVEVLAGSLRTRQELTTLDAGLGQSRLPLWFGLGKANQADTLRVRWPDGVPQSELALPAGQLAKITEQNRKGTSCPILLAWNGEGYGYVTDFLGGGALAELGPDGSIRPPRPEESVKIEGHQLQPKDGKLRLKLAEPMDEVMYLDHLKLEVVDHPAGSEVHPDERFSTGGPAPTQRIQQFDRKHYPIKANNHRGDNVLAQLTQRDTRTVDRFAHRRWLGFAEDHFVELHFNNLPSTPLTMVLAGWIDYAYPESIYAAHQAGVPMIAPMLEREVKPGQWEKVCDLGFPAGLPKVMTRDLPELLGMTNLKLRIRTNLQVYWDEIYLGSAISPTHVNTLSVTHAELHHRGFMQEISRGGTSPVEYNDTRTELVNVTKWKGKLTRLGNVTPLLSKLDDQFVLCGPGDEVLVEFDVSQLSPPSPGSTRSYVLRTFGYCKDTSPFTLTGGQVGPLPHRAMIHYPNDLGSPPPEQQEYDRQWNTR